MIVLPGNIAERNFLYAGVSQMGLCAMISVSIDCFCSGVSQHGRVSVGSRARTVCHATSRTRSLAIGGIDNTGIEGAHFD